VLARWRSSGVASVGVLVCGVIVGEWDVIVGPNILGMDTATAFYPWFAFLGESLRGGTVPAWNPYQFAGAPYAADPESGWMYLPAMATFTLFALPQAAKSFIVLQALLSALFTYALARTLGAIPVAAAFAGVTYALSGFLFGHGLCCFAYASVGVWLPLILLGAERAIRRTSWLHRVSWWGVAGLGLSQVFAAWLGQGSYYAVLLLGAYLVYRAMLAPARRDVNFWRRLVDLLQHGAGVLLFAIALGAAGLLPRLEYNALSNLPGGYPDSSASVLPSLTDWGFVRDWNVLLLTPSFYYAGITACALAFAAPLVAARRLGVALFWPLGFAVLVLSRLEPTPLHALLSILPYYERLTSRSPERALIVIYLLVCILGALTLTALPRARHALAWLLLGVALVDLNVANRILLAQAQRGEAAYELKRVDLGEYFELSPSLQFLRSRDGTFRYFGYAQHIYGSAIPYTLRWMEPRFRSLGVNNIGLGAALRDIQGYNPVHVARYDEFIAAVNGQAQNYHHADVLGRGVNSSLLDLLNVRYVIVPAVTASDEMAAQLQRAWSPVYEDRDVRIFENPHALGHYRIVHGALQVRPGAALDVLRDGALDPRRTAVLEATPPTLELAVDPEADQVHQVAHEANRIELTIDTGAPGLLVLSEVYYPAWRAFVDNQPVPLYVVDHVLRGVPIPAGVHTVELRYESTTLQIGLLITVCAYGLLLGLPAACCAGALRRSLRRRAGSPWSALQGTHRQPADEEPLQE
jgi:Bacterial membrane protein YfhO